MVMAALTALKSTNDDLDIYGIPVGLIVMNRAAQEVEPHPQAILSVRQKQRRREDLPVLSIALVLPCRSG